MRSESTPHAIELHFQLTGDQSVRGDKAVFHIGPKAAVGPVCRTADSDACGGAWLEVADSLFQQLSYALTAVDHTEFVMHEFSGVRQAYTRSHPHEAFEIIIKRRESVIGENAHFYVAS